MLNLVITNDDIERSEKLQRQERLDVSSSDGLFMGLVYVLLSAKEKYTRQMLMYNRLLDNGLDSPDAIIKNGSRLGSFVKGLRKEEYLLNISRWWKESDIYDLIYDDVVNGRENEFYLRDKIAKNSAGIAYKCSSLFMNMCGYRNVVTLDSWALRALVEEDYPVKSYRHNSPNISHTYLGKGIFRDRGITSRKEYLLYESYFTELVQKYNEKFDLSLDAFTFKQILWAKKSSWGEKFGNDTNQMIIDF